MPITGMILLFLKFYFIFKLYIIVLVLILLLKWVLTNAGLVLEVALEINL